MTIRWAGDQVPQQTSKDGAADWERKLDEYREARERAQIDRDAQVILDVALVGKHRRKDSEWPPRDITTGSQLANR